MPLTLNNIVPIALTAIALFLATNLHNHSLSYLYFISSFTLLLSIVFIKLFTYYNSSIKLPDNSYILLFLLFTGWSLLSTIWSPAPSDSFYSAIIFLVFPLGLLLGFWSNSKQQQYFPLALAIFIIITLIKAYYQKFILVPHLHAPGFFSNKNTNATFIAMILLPFSTYFLTGKGTTYKKHVIGIIIACSTFIITLTVSRGAVLGLGLGLLLIFAHNLLEKHSIRSFLILIAYLLLGVLIAEMLTGANYFDRVIKQSITTDITTISTGRDYIWNSGWQMYLEQPFLGRGLNMFHWLFPQFRHSDSPDIGQFAHNDYLQFLIELGPIGFFLFIGFVLTFLKSSWLLYTKTADKDQKLSTLGLITPCIAVLIHSVFTFNLYQPAPLLLMGLYMGVLTQRLEQLKLQKSITFIPSKIKIVTKTGYIGILSSVSLILIYFIATESLSLYKVYQSYPNNLVALENTLQASSLAPYKEEYIATQANLYVELLSKDADMFTEEGKQQLIDKGIATVEDAIKKNPFRDLNQINKARLYLFNTTEHSNYFTEISNGYSEAIRLDPFNLQTRLHFTDILMGFEKKEDAIKIMRGGLDRTYVSNYKNGILYLQSLLALVITTNNQPAIENIKQQLDNLIDKKGKGGRFTLQNYK
jgi:O-antigen ligase